LLRHDRLLTTTERLERGGDNTLPTSEFENDPPLVLADGVEPLASEAKGT
jgi:hypothetical protein